MGLILFVIISAVASANVENKFERRLFHLIMSEYKANMFFSPRAARISLGLIYLATVRRTSTELLMTLDMPPEEKQEGMESFKKLYDDFINLPVQFLIRLYLPKRYKIKEDFNDIAKRYLNSGVDVVDFVPETANYINDWIRENTKHPSPYKINGSLLVGRMMLLSTVYLSVKLSNFHKTSGIFYDDIQHVVPMIYRVGLYPYSRLEPIADDIVEVPFGKHGLSLLLIMPADGEHFLNSEKRLADRNIANVADSVLKKSWVNITMPIFKASMNLPLGDKLDKLNMTRITNFFGTFNALLKPGSCSYLTSFLTHSLLNIEMENPSDNLKPPEGTTVKELIFDHPFVFFIRRADTVYFRGYVSWIPEV